MKTIKIGNYELDIYNNGPIGISLSGGADSALLLYILMSHITQPIHIYSIISPARREAMEIHTDRIVQVCSRLTGNINFTHHKDIVIDQLPDIMFSTLTHNMNRDNIEILYFGLTKFPPREVYDHFLEKQPEWHIEFRDDSKIRPLYGVTIPLGKNRPNLAYPEENGEKTELVLDNRVYNPFINLNKKDIASMYADLKIMEVFLASRSCEDATHIGTHCGKCWWCDERKWGFGYLE
jgi:7-cyano-7-deazaguanine synthase in queuosine biosynthesis